MNNLILIRHGQSLWNKERRFTGWADIDLTTEGRFEAESAGNFIKDLNIKFDSYFTSELKRAINTLKIILKILNKSEAKFHKAWELNERHYGDLTSLNKDEMIKKHGIEQVQIWRRSYDIAPPIMNPQHSYRNDIYNKIKKSKQPDSESLKDTFDRVVPYYKKNIEPLILSKKNILIAAHGNSLRALCKKLFLISKEKIIDFELPTGNPLLIRFDENLKIKDYRYLDNKRAKKILFNV